MIKGEKTMEKSVQLRYFEGERYNGPDAGNCQWVLDNTFDALCQIKRSHELPSGLYHYVRKDKSCFVLKPDADISCGHASCQNDPCEICTGCIAFVEYCRKMQVLSSSQLQIVENLLRYNLILPKLKGMPSLNDRASYPPAMPWIFCTTPNNDSPYQWRNYTDRNEGGYCYCFDVSKLEKAIQRRNGQHKDSVLILLPCYYLGRDDDAIEQIFKALLQDMYRDISMLREAKHPSTVDQQTLNRIQGAILTVAPLIKHRKWAHEQEWRLVLIRGCNLNAEQYLPSQLSEVCEHPINLMTAIKVSPQGNERKLREHIESLNDGVSRMVTASRVSMSVVEHYIKLEDDKLDMRYENHVLSQPIGGDVMSQAEFLAELETTTVKRT